jgi:hypothetical protein
MNGSRLIIAFTFILELPDLFLDTCIQQRLQRSEHQPLGSLANPNPNLNTRSLKIHMQQVDVTESIGSH